MALAAVPVISMIKLSQWFGVPVRLVVIDVIATVSAVILCISVLSVLIVGVADDASDVTLSVTLLFVNVTVAEFFVASLVLSTFHNQTSHFTIPVGVFITGEVKVLFVSVCVAVKPTSC